MKRKYYGQQSIFGGRCILSEAELKYLNLILAK
jgi:hypothetical protein